MRGSDLCDLLKYKLSSKLKPKETSIWSEKLTKTSKDVLTFLKDAKSAGKKSVKVQPCFECSNKLDSLLFMLSPVLHLVKTDQAKAAAVEEASKATLDAAEQSLGQSGDYAEESNCNIGAINTAPSEIAEAPTNGHKAAAADQEVSKATDDVVEQSMEETKCSAKKASSRNDYPATGNETEAAATIANMLNSVKSSDDCSDLSKKEEFRKKAWAIYNQPSQPHPFGRRMSREEAWALDSDAREYNMRVWESCELRRKREAEEILQSIKK